MDRFALTVLATLAVFAVAFWFQLAVWNECRAHNHSWFYCLRIVSAK